jgi:hypothetical protein
MQHSQELYELMLLTYKSSLNHTKLSIKMKLESQYLMDSSCNCLNLTDVDALVQKATNIEQKILFLKKQRGYLIENKKVDTSGTTDCQEVKVDKEIKDDNIEKQNNDYVKLEVVEKNEVVEVSKDDVIKAELRTQVGKELLEKVLEVLRV